MAKRYKQTVVIDQAALKKATSYGDGVREVLSGEVQQIAQRSNAMSAGFRTGRYYDRESNELRGNTQPKYGGSVKLGNYGWVGLVHPENYAAMKDNHEHNTLLKAKKG